VEVVLFFLALFLPPFIVLHFTGTGNELKHLARIHPEVKVGLLRPAPDAIGSLSGMSEVVRRQSSIEGSVKVAPNYVKQAVRWIVDRFHPLSEVEAGSCREKMKSIHPSVEMLTSHRVRCEIQNLAASVRNKFKEKFHNAEAKVAITTDAWTGNDGNSYICLTVHFSSKDLEMQSFCTGVLHCGVDGHGAVECANMLVSLLMQTGLRRDQIEALVTDTESTMQKLGRFFEDEFQFHPRPTTPPLSWQASGSS